MFKTAVFHQTEGFCRTLFLPEEPGLAGPVLEPPSEFRAEGFTSWLELVFRVELPALDFPLCAALLPVAFSAGPAAFLVLAAELFVDLFAASASGSAMQAPCGGGSGGRSLTGAGGGS